MSTFEDQIFSRFFSLSPNVDISLSTFLLLTLNTFLPGWHVSCRKTVVTSRMHKRGFTLVELLISFALITFLISGTAQLTMHSLLAKRRADFNLKSAELAASKLEHFKSLDYESDELHEGIQKETIKEDGTQQVFLLEWRIQDTSLNMKRIEVECCIKKFPQKKTSICLLLSRKLGF